MYMVDITFDVIILLNFSKDTDDREKATVPAKAPSSLKLPLSVVEKMTAKTAHEASQVAATSPSKTSSSSTSVSLADADQATPAKPANETGPKNAIKAKELKDTKKPNSNS